MWKKRKKESEVTQSCPTLRDCMDCLFLLQGIFLTQGSNPGILHCRQILYGLNHQSHKLNMYSSCMSISPHAIIKEKTNIITIIIFYLKITYINIWQGFVLGLELRVSHMCHVELSSWEGEGGEWKRTEAKIQGSTVEKTLSQTQNQSQGSGGNSVSGYNVVACLNALKLSCPGCKYAPWGGGGKYGHRWTSLLE